MALIHECPVDGAIRICGANGCPACRPDRAVELCDAADREMMEARSYAGALAMERDDLQARLAAAEARAEKAEGERDRYKAALDKINVIRNSIVACQGFNFSEHAYPLVAALNAAGIEGDAYPVAKAYFGGMLERAVKAEDEARYLREHRAWQSKRFGMCECPTCKKWLAANPEPQPPEGCEP